jgi:hypothetical protein
VLRLTLPRALERNSVGRKSRSHKPKRLVPAVF